MSRFSENVILVQYFAYLNALLVFIEISRRQIQTTIETISTDVPRDIIQESGEDLGTLLGRAIEEKTHVKSILNFLEELL